MLNKKFRKGAIALALAGFAGVALATVSVDEDGVGFVGKGDVQLLFDWNNKTLQACVGPTGQFSDQPAGCLSFRLASSTVQETTWTCDKDAGPQTQERARTTTTTFQGLIASTARVKTQVTGFNLAGFDGEPETETETDGPAVGSCPTGWTAIDLVEGTPTGGDSTLEVKANDSDWETLPITQ